jgi:predicted amidohydrolase YtcJ
LNKYVEAGLTSVATNDFGFGVSNDLLFDTMIQLEKEKQLPLNMYHQVKVNSLKDAKESLKYFKKKTGMVRFLSYKIISDGSLGASTASMIEPYLNQGDNCGQMLIMKEEIIKIVNFANKHNIKVAIHVIGDNSLKTVLRAFKEAKKTKVKNQLIHCSLLYKGAAKLIKKLKLQVSYQPYFVNSDINFIKERLDGKRLEY